MNFISLSFCLMLVGKFFGICASEETFELLPLIEGKYSKTLQERHNSLKTALDHYSAILHRNRSIPHATSQKKSITDPRFKTKSPKDVLVEALIKDGEVSQDKLDKQKKEHEYYQKQCNTFCCCCPYQFSHLPSSFHLIELEEEAQKALKSLEISMEERA